MATTEQILGSIEQRIRELRGEIDALAAARAEFVGSRSESRKRPTRTKRSAEAETPVRRRRKARSR